MLQVLLFDCAGALVVVVVYAFCRIGVCLYCFSAIGWLCLLLGFFILFCY